MAEQLKCQFDRSKFSEKQLVDCGHMCVRACVPVRTLAGGIAGVTVSNGTVEVDYPEDEAYSIGDNHSRGITKGEVQSFVKGVLDN